MRDHHASKTRPLSERALADQALETEVQRIYAEDYGALLTSSIGSTDGASDYGSEG